jgi:hypothetical protein
MEDKRFKAPIKDKKFEKYWNLYIGDVTARDNFKLGHLEHLRILCQIMVNFDKLQAQIDRDGFTYETDPDGKSRYGNQVKVNPACTLRDKILAEIRQYSKMLGLLLEKDKVTNEKGDKDEWE